MDSLLRVRSVLQKRKKLQNDTNLVTVHNSRGVFEPDKNGLKFLAGGLEGINESRLTSEAAVGPKNASGVLLV